MFFDSLSAPADFGGGCLLRGRTKVGFPRNIGKNTMAPLVLRRKIWYNLKLRVKKPSYAFLQNTVYRVGKIEYGMFCKKYVPAFLQIMLTRGAPMRAAGDACSGGRALRLRGAK